MDSKMPVLITLVTTLISPLLCSVDALDVDHCFNHLGMENHHIKDSQITASTSYDVNVVGPQNARLRQDKNGGAWCPKYSVSKEAKEFLEVNVEELHVITGIITQGRYGNGQGQEYAEEYMLDYWRPGFKKWRRWRSRKFKELLSGNTNTYSEVEQSVDPPVIATKIKIIPHSDHVRTICMRVEIIGCTWTEGLVAYSMPQGFHRGTEMDFSDRTYDGFKEGNMLNRGLGQLVDGKKGDGNYRADISGLGKGYEWVGWRTDQLGPFVDVVFEFDRVRNFSAVLLHSNNMVSKDVQIFASAKIYFSNNGRQYTGDPITFFYTPDTKSELARDVAIQLHHRVGRFVKMQLYFAKKWMLISEVSFIHASKGQKDPVVQDVLSPTVQKRKDLSFQDDQVSFGPAPRKKVPSDPPEKIDTVSGPIVVLLISLLTFIVVIMFSAILFVILKNQHLRMTPANHIISPREFVDDKRVTFNSSNDSNYNAHYTTKPTLKSFKGITDMYGGSMNDEMVSNPNYEPSTNHFPGFSERSGSFGSYGQRPISKRDSCKNVCPSQILHDFLPGPPKGPPPSINEKFYAATEIYNLSPRKPNQNVHNYGQGKSSSTTTSLVSSSPRMSMSMSQRSTPRISSPLFQSKISGVQVPLRKDGRRVLDQVGNEEREENPDGAEMADFNVVSKLGSCQFGDVFMCQSGFQFTALKTLKSGCSEALRQEFSLEIKTLAALKNPNVVQLLTSNVNAEHPYAIFEYLQYGDLYQYLQNHVAESPTNLVTFAKTLSYNILIDIITQISFAMKYLESLNFVHKDLATRNCLVGENNQIKVSTLNVARTIYPTDYYAKDMTVASVPIRWMAWESVIFGNYSSKTDVWSFAVTAWEILTFAREQPYEEMSDRNVIENAKKFSQNNSPVYLEQPINCPDDVYDMLKQCWSRESSQRPCFKDVYGFFERRNSFN